MEVRAGHRSEVEQGRDTYHTIPYHTIPYLSRSVDVPDGEQIPPRSSLGPDLAHHELPPLVAGADEHAFEDGDDILGRHDVPIASAPSLRDIIAHRIISCVWDEGGRGETSGSRSTATITTVVFRLEAQLLRK